MATNLMQWNKEEFGHIEKRKKRLWARLEGIQKVLATPGKRHLLKLEKKLQTELESTLNQEEIMWFQRSREEWIRSGESNTRFYHAATTVRKNRKKVDSLKNDRAEWISEPSRIEEVVQDYFQSLFREEVQVGLSISTPNNFPRLS